MKTTKRKFYSQEYGWLEEVSFKVMGVTVWREINPCPPIEVDEALVIKTMPIKLKESLGNMTVSNEAFDAFQAQQRARI